MTPLRGALGGAAVALLLPVLIKMGLAPEILVVPLLFLLVVTGSWGMMLFPAPHRTGTYVMTPVAPGQGLAPSRPAIYFSYVAFVALFALAGWCVALVWPRRRSSGRPIARRPPPR